MPFRTTLTVLAALTAALLMATAPRVVTAAQDAPSGGESRDDDRSRRGVGQDRGQNRGNRQIDPARLVARMMQSDADGDGRISRAEVGRGRFADLFDEADADKDGYVTEREMTVFLTERRPGGAAPRGERPADDAAPVDSKAAFDKGMAESGRALRGLRRTPFDETSFDRDLTSVIRVQDGLLAARGHVGSVPMSDAAKEKFGTDRRAYLRSFQAHMAKSLVTSFQLEIAILEGDSSKAKELTDALVGDRNGSHDLFEN